MFKLKKALRKGAFFAFLVSTFVLLFLVQVSAQADNCVPNNSATPGQATVKFVYDGDTLLLTDKRKIRIIGIDTPETKHHQQKAQAYGAKAREALRALLKKYNNRVVLRYGKERLDKYGRTLAHVYLADGTNISNWLLERGFAKTLAFSPNVNLANCYKKSEKIAQAQSLRIWRYKSNRVRDAATLPRRVSGYVRLRGVVTKIKHHKKSLILELASQSKSHIRIKIKKRYLRYFKQTATKDINPDKFPDKFPDKLLNKTIIVTGTLKNKKRKRTIFVSHPSQISFDVSHASNVNIKTGLVKNRKKLKAEKHLKWSLENETKAK